MGSLKLNLVSGDLGYIAVSSIPNADVYLLIQHPNEPVWVLRLE